LVAWLARKGFNARYGARPLQRLLERRIVAELARFLLAAPALRDAVIDVDYTATALANGGQKALLVRQERCSLWRPPVAKDGQGRSYADTTLLLWPLVRQDRHSRLAAYRGQWRTKGTRGGQRLMIVIRQFSQRSRQTNDQ
jgi:hypothetical protein